MTDRAALSALTLDQVAARLPEAWSAQYAARTQPLAPTRDDGALGPCWRWTGAKTRNGYGQMRTVSRAPSMVYREVYKVIVGPIPPGFEADHLCRHVWCVRPSHFEAVSGKENLRRMREGLKREKLHASIDAMVRHARFGVYR